MRTAFSRIATRFDDLDDGVASRRGYRRDGRQCCRVVHSLLQYRDAGLARFDVRLLRMAKAGAPGRTELIIDGARFGDLDGFYREVSSQLIPGECWGRNLNAFNDVLRGGFGTPGGGFVLRWRNSERSRAVLGYPGTVRWLCDLLTRSPDGGDRRLAEQLAAAEQAQGKMLFEVLVAIIRVHGPGGAEAEDGVDLILA